jgi:hypothetical protein
MYWYLGLGGQNNIYKDMSIGHIGSGLLWVGPFKKAGNYRTATINCYELSNGQYGIKANWRIPTYFEFVNAYNRGLKKQFPNVINTRFWTSTPYATAPSDKHYYVIGIRGLHEQPQLFVVHGETSSEANYCVMRDVNFDWAGLQSQNEE